MLKGQQFEIRRDSNLHLQLPNLISEMVMSACQNSILHNVHLNDVNKCNKILQSSIRYEEKESKRRIL